MNKFLLIYLYGAVIIFEGVFLLFSDKLTFNFISLVTGVTLTLGAVLAFMAAFSRQRQPVQFAYHEIHAIAMLVYAISTLAFCDTIEKLFSFTAFLFIFYMFSEIIFCFWLFNLGQKLIYKIIFVRLLLGLSTGIGTVIAMNFSTFTLEGFGLLFIAVGINIMLYVPVMKVKQFSDESYVPTEPIQ